jgi:membrane protein
MYTWATLKRTIREVRDDNLTDWAAALTYYSVLALFPGLIVLVAILGLVGQHPETTNALLDIVRDVGPASAVDTFRGPIESVVKSNSGAGALLGVSLLFAIWSASGYVGAFIRAINVIYEVEDGRPFWKRRPLQIVITGPLARAIGDEVGLGDTAITIWNIAKWPVVVVVVTGMFTVLYYVAPNVRQPRLRWVTPGGIVAVVLWLLASAGFGLYVANFGSYDKTYGSLVWLWLSNLALLFGAEFDAELERSRELAAGLPAEESLQLPERDPPKAD